MVCFEKNQNVPNSTKNRFNIHRKVSQGVRENQQIQMEADQCIQHWSRKPSPGVQVWTANLVQYFQPAKDQRLLAGLTR